MNQTTENQINQLAGAVDVASESWSGWDWCHAPGRCTCDAGNDDVPVTVGPMTISKIVAHGHTEACARRILEAQEFYEAGAQAAAKRASDHGQCMLDCLRTGDVDGASDAIHAACRVESEYGDCPVWGQVREQFMTAQRKGDI